MSGNGTERTLDRRGLFVALARAVSAALLTGGAALLALRNGASGECPPRTACGACRLREGCDRKPRRERS